ncbi:hypothetical protein vBSdyM006_039 [Shigella phage vB_SdyM_006]|nr:hypothetical protein vBSdyM006_039 [Shigella phage vB_SdyM_006]
MDYYNKEFWNVASRGPSFFESQSMTQQIATQVSKAVRTNPEIKCISVFTYNADRFPNWERTVVEI